MKSLPENSKNQGKKVIHKVYDRFLDLLAFVAALIIFLIMVGVGFSVATRALGYPIGWIIEFTEYGLLFILFLGMPWLVRERGHVAIELVVDLSPPNAAKAMKVGSTIIAGVNCVIISYASLVATIDNYVRNVETFGIYPIPRFILFAFVSGGFFLTSIEFFRWTALSIRKPKEKEKDRSPENSNNRGKISV